MASYEYTLSRDVAILYVFYMYIARQFTWQTVRVDFSVGIVGSDGVVGCVVVVILCAVQTVTT